MSRAVCPPRVNGITVGQAHTYWEGRANDPGHLVGTLVPDEGPADTVELIRSVVRLASECYRKGNINWRPDGF